MVVELLAEGDTQTAQGVLDAAGVTLPTGDLNNGAYDEMGNFYQMPEQIISDPVNVVSQDIGVKGESLESDTEEMDEDDIERRREEKGKGVLKSVDTVKVKARLSDRGGPDVVILLAKDQNVRVLVRRIQDEAGVRRPRVIYKRPRTN